MTTQAGYFSTLSHYIYIASNTIISSDTVFSFAFATDNHKPSILFKGFTLFSSQMLDQQFTRSFMYSLTFTFPLFSLNPCPFVCFSPEPYFLSIAYTELNSTLTGQFILFGVVHVIILIYFYDAKKGVIHLADVTISNCIISATSIIICIGTRYL